MVAAATWRATRAPEPARSDATAPGRRRSRITTHASTTTPDAAIPTHTSRWGSHRRRTVTVAGTVRGERPTRWRGRPRASAAPTVAPSTSTAQPVARALAQDEPEGRSVGVDLGLHGRRRRSWCERAAPDRRARHAARRRTAAPSVPVERTTWSMSQPVTRPTVAVRRWLPAPRSRGAQEVRLAESSAGVRRRRQPDRERGVRRPSAGRRGTADQAPPRRRRQRSTGPCPAAWKDRANGISKRRSRWDSSSRRSVPGRSRRKAGEHDVEAVAVQVVADAIEEVDRQADHLGDLGRPTPISASPTGVKGSSAGPAVDAGDLDVQAARRPARGSGRPDPDGLEGLRAQDDLEGLAVGDGDPAPFARPGPCGPTAAAAGAARPRWEPCRARG